MKRIYLAGAYTSTTAMGVIENIKNGVRLSTEVLLAGYAPYAPWLDFHFQLMLREDERIELSDYASCGLAWLEVSEAVLVVPGWEESKGTKNELEHAKKLSIPVFFSINELVESLR